MSVVDTSMEEDRDYFDSMKQASAALDIPMRVLKQMKKGGCLGFKGSRVYRDEVMAWLPRYNLDDFTEELTATEKVQIKVLEERLRRLKLQNDAEERLFIAVAEIAPQLIRIASSQRAVLIEKLENDLPERLTGKSASEIRATLKGVVDDICRIFNQGGRVMLRDVDPATARAAAVALIDELLPVATNGGGR